jgi:hypothetical protein
LVVGPIDPKCRNIQVDSLPTRMSTLKHVL